MVTSVLGDWTCVRYWKPAHYVRLKEELDIYLLSRWEDLFKVRFVGMPGVLVVQKVGPVMGVPVGINP